MRLGQGSACTGSVELTMKWVRSWDPEIKPFEPESYPLFAHITEDGDLIVSLKETEFFTLPIVAKEVPEGSRLASGSEQFFEFWKGKSAIRNGRLIPTKEKTDGHKRHTC